jgi:acetyltransferase-like isoleucine patch superfamily enzyme
MSYYASKEQKKIEFRKLGKNVKISNNAKFYFPKDIEIGDNSRIDDFCILSGKIIIGKFAHPAPMCLIGCGIKRVFISDFATLAYGVKIFSQSDDYVRGSMTNSTVCKEFKNVKYSAVTIGKHVIIGTNTVIMPGCNLREGSSIGAMSLVTKKYKKVGNILWSASLI